MDRGTPASSSTTAAQYSTLVTIRRPGFHSARAARISDSMAAASSTSSPPRPSAASRSRTPRGSAVRYTAWPKPMIFSPLSSRSATQPRAAEGSPISSIIARARLGAPPCRGPERAPMAATIEPAMSAPVLATTRAVNVEALKPWSMVATR